jgi:hypothetical protein
MSQTITQLSAPARSELNAWAESYAAAIDKAVKVLGSDAVRAELAEVGAAIERAQVKLSAIDTAVFKKSS